MRKFFIIAALAGALVLTVPGAATAACAPAGSTADGLRQAPVVFVGTATTVENQGRTATFDVLSVWKGRGVVAEVTVNGAVDEAGGLSGDDQKFQSGVTYLVATTTSANPYRTDRCSATRVWNDAPSLIPTAYQGAVGATVGQSPDPVPAVVDDGTLLDGPVLVIVVGAAVLAVITLGLARITRGPGHVARKTRRTAGSGSDARSKLPSIGRSGDTISGGLRRSGVSQAERLRKGVRRKKKLRSSRTKRDAGAAKPKRGKRGLRTDRLPQSSDGAASKETSHV